MIYVKRRDPVNAAFAAEEKTKKKPNKMYQRTKGIDPKVFVCLKKRQREKEWQEWQYSYSTTILKVHYEVPLGLAVATLVLVLDGNGTVVSQLNRSLVIVGGYLFVNFSFCLKKLYLVDRGEKTYRKGRGKRNREGTKKEEIWRSGAANRQIKLTAVC